MDSNKDILNFEIQDEANAFFVYGNAEKVGVKPMKSLRHRKWCNYIQKTRKGLMETCYPMKRHRKTEGENPKRGQRAKLLKNYQRCKIDQASLPLWKMGACLYSMEYLSEDLAELECRTLGLEREPSLKGLKELVEKQKLTFPNSHWEKDLSVYCLAFFHWEK